MYEWLLFLHVLLAFAVVAAMVVFTYVVVVGRKVDVPSEAVRLFRISRVGEVLVNVGMVGLLLIGIWLAIDSDEYKPWDGWLIAAYVLWAIFAEVGRREGKIFNAARDRARALVTEGNDAPSAELNALLRSPTGLTLQLVAIVIVLLFLVDMVYKPGA